MSVEDSEEEKAAEAYTLKILNERPNAIQMSAKEFKEYGYYFKVTTGVLYVPDAFLAGIEWERKRRSGRKPPSLTEEQIAAKNAAIKEPSK